MSLVFDPSALKPLPEGRQNLTANGRAAVLVAIVGEPDNYSLLLTKRALHLSNHGGEVAFPGGMWEPGDQFPQDTALREAQEEVALSVHQANVMGLLPSQDTRNSTRVTPVVATIPADLPLTPSPDEIHSIFYVPLAELLADHRVRTDVFQYRGLVRWVPVFEFQGYEIWGFTAGVIITLLERCFGAKFARQHSAPEKLWSV